MRRLGLSRAGPVLMRDTAMSLDDIQARVSRIRASLDEDAVPLPRILPPTLDLAGLTDRVTSIRNQLDLASLSSENPVPPSMPDSSDVEAQDDLNPLSDAATDPAGSFSPEAFGSSDPSSGLYDRTMVNVAGALHYMQHHHSIDETATSTLSAALEQLKTATQDDRLRKLFQRFASHVERFFLRWSMSLLDRALVHFWRAYLGADQSSAYDRLKPFVDALDDPSRMTRTILFRAFVDRPTAYEPAAYVKCSRKVARAERAEVIDHLNKVNAPDWHKISAFQREVAAMVQKFIQAWYAGHTLVNSIRRNHSDAGQFTILKKLLSELEEADVKKWQACFPSVSVPFLLGQTEYSDIWYAYESPDGHFMAWHGESVESVPLEAAETVRMPLVRLEADSSCLAHTNVLAYVEGILHSLLPEPITTNILATVPFFLVDRAHLDIVERVLLSALGPMASKEERAILLKRAFGSTMMLSDAVGTTRSSEDSFWSKSEGGRTLSHYLCAVATHYGVTLDSTDVMLFADVHRGSGHPSNLVDSGEALADAHEVVHSLVQEHNPRVVYASGLVAYRAVKKQVNPPNLPDASFLDSAKRIVPVVAGPSPNQLKRQHYSAVARDRTFRPVLLSVALSMIALTSGPSTTASDIMQRGRETLPEDFERIAHAKATSLNAFTRRYQLLESIQHLPAADTHQFLHRLRLKGASLWRAERPQGAVEEEGLVVTKYKGPTRNGWGLRIGSALLETHLPTPPTAELAEEEILLRPFFESETLSLRFLTASGSLFTIAGVPYEVSSLLWLNDPKKRDAIIGVLAEANSRRPGTYSLDHLPEPSPERFEFASRMAQAVGNRLNYLLEVERRVGTSARDSRCIEVAIRSLKESTIRARGYLPTYLSYQDNYTWPDLLYSDGEYAGLPINMVEKLEKQPMNMLGMHSWDFMRHLVYGWWCYNEDRKKLRFLLAVPDKHNPLRWKAGDWLKLRSRSHRGKDLGTIVFEYDPKKYHRRMLEQDGFPIPPKLL